MNITIHQELRAYIDPLTSNEYQALERSILAEGCRDALVLWGEILVDGHNRYAICQQHGIAFNTTQNTRFADIEDVMLWMIDNHLGRRSVTDFQRGMYALRKKEIVANRNLNKEKQASDITKADSQSESQSDFETPVMPSASQSREELAKTAGISSNTVTQIEKIRRTATPELVDAVRAGTISINAAATVATLPPEQQVTAVTGGRKELQLAAKQVREMKSANKPISLKVSNSEINIEANNEKVASLIAENTSLKEKIAELTAALEAARAIHASS